MLKVETTTQQTIDPKDLTDKHFIGVVNDEGCKGYVMKLTKFSYTIAFLHIDANAYDRKRIDKSIKQLIVAYMDKFECQIFATLDYEEFKEWYFSK